MSSARSALRRGGEKRQHAVAPRVPIRLEPFRVRRPHDHVPISEEILDTTIIPAFEAAVRQHANQIAIRTQGTEISYRQLNNAVNYLARQVAQEAGASRAPVAVLAEQEILVIAACLAVLKTGRPFVTLHPGSPREELRGYLEDSDAEVLLTGASLVEAAQEIAGRDRPPSISVMDRLHTEENIPNPEYRVEPNAPFAIFYTSGSTGRPKGVLDGHLSKSFSAYCKRNALYFGPSDRISLVLSPWHSAGFSVAFGTLISGASLCPFDVGHSSAREALEWMQETGITILWCTPSTFRSMFGVAAAGRRFPALRVVRVGGEPTTRADVKLFKAHTRSDCALITNYSSSEAALVCEFAIYHDSLPPGDFVPGGFPLPGNEVLILDEHGQAARAGEEGEICVSSPYLALGYWNNPELTAQVFTAHPADPQKRLCHTGDMGRWRADGSLEVLGRKDTQVKIRGFRVHLEAVDLTLRSLQGVADAASLAVYSSSRGARLAAYIAMSPGYPFSVSRLRKDLALRLPSHAIPTMFVEMNALPRTATGKLARTKLPPAQGRRPAMDHPYVAPRNGLEQDITRIWERVLETEGIGVHDSFFDLGGDSLMTLELTLELEKSLQRPVPRDFLKRPTIAALAELVADPSSEYVEDDPFAVARRRKTMTQRITDLKRKLSPANLKRATHRGFAGERIDRLVDSVVARRIRAMPYHEARDWAQAWSRNTTARRALYRRRAALIERWVGGLEGCTANPSEVLELSVLSNVLHGSAADAFRRLGYTGHSIQAYKDSPFAYWRTLGEMLEELPPEELRKQLPVEGLEHLQAAHAKGKGVVILSFHGFPMAGGILVLKLLLGMKWIPTITYQVTRRGTPYAVDDPTIPEEETAALNARIALLGQKTLQQGGIINFASDWADFHGRPYRVLVGGRLYPIKGGFAEMALNTGATIVPYLRRCLPDGRLQMQFEAPFDVGNGERAEQVEQLVQKYGAFIQDSFARYPESMKWSDILSHFLRPASSEDP